MKNNEQEIINRLYDKLKSQFTELLVFCEGDPLMASEMAGFMKTVIGQFMDFNTDQRKMLLKLLIETDEIVEQAVKETEDALRTKKQE